MHNKLVLSYTPDPLNANFKIDEVVLDIDELYFTVDKKAHEFYETYKTRPVYIKFPEWAYRALKRAGDTSLIARPIGSGLGNPFEPERLFGYILCHTETIKELNEIELF